VNILIIGALLLVGIAAIIGAVLISLGESRREAAASFQGNRPVTPARSAAPTEATQRTEQVPVSPRPMATTDTSGPLSHIDREHSLTTLEGAQKLPALNGQFHELANEIRALHQQAWQFEQRLNVLTEMVNQVEKTQSGHVNFDDDEEQMQFPTDNTHS
jgi:hypothetical protein